MHIKARLFSSPPPKRTQSKKVNHMLGIEKERNESQVKKATQEQRKVIKQTSYSNNHHLLHLLMEDPEGWCGNRPYTSR